MTCGKCGSHTAEPIEIPMPPMPGAGPIVVHICVICGENVERAEAPDHKDSAAHLADMAESALDAGAPRDDVMALLLRGQFEAGVVYGSMITARSLVKKVTFRGRLKRIRAMWPLDTEAKRQEAEALLLMGDNHNGS
tara:strand:- start:123 stop:533 length:411 start_codon:yes stop_codon:yes gene_type:complete